MLPPRRSNDDARAVVIGAGWAGEGHTVALRAAGVEVVAMCGRTPAPARDMAAQLGIEDVRFDWRQALQELRPDVVAIATPGGPHREMAVFAAGLGCHVFCDKPLAVDAAEARAMLEAVERAGVKHAYGSTSRYAPLHLYARRLLADGLIGPLREIESQLHAAFPPATPYFWLHSHALGGGLLNNAFTHKLGQVLAITGAGVTAAMGEARTVIERAPVGPPVHDMRTLFATIPAPGAAAEWRAVDADMAYTAVLQLALPGGSPVSALFKGSVYAAARHPDSLDFYGERGTLHLSEDRIEHFDAATKTWHALEVPAAIVSSLPQVADPVQRDWNQLVREFVADIRGEGTSAYPTFREGWLHHAIIDIVRSGRGWTPLPPNPLAF